MIKKKKIIKQRSAIFTRLIPLFHYILDLQGHHVDHHYPVYPKINCISNQNDANTSQVTRMGNICGKINK